MRPGPISATSHRDDLFPEYGLDDPGFDEYEWHQTAGLRELEEPDAIEVWEVSGRGRERDGLSALLTAPEWREGNWPRPGFGPGRAMVRANATVRPLTALVGWIRQWEPEG